MNILLAGGAGYIGSHTAVSLLDAGHDVIIADNFMNSSPVAVDRIREVSGKPVTCYRADVCDTAAMERIFSENAVDCVIHFAGLKGVGESGTVPLKYYRNNIDTTLTLLECMAKFGVHNVVFSSSATVYGDENPIPYVETMRRGSSSHPYGWTKIFMEQIFEDAAKADPDLSVVLLRYFNPIGAHPSGRMGEDPRGVPNNLMPYISQVAVGRREQLTVFGDDYPTPDGTCRRDYLHVMDLAEGHLEAVEYAAGHKGTEVFNLGTGTPYSVLEIVHAFEEATGVAIPYIIGPRRAGDLPEFWADAAKAERVLHWTAKRDLTEMCRDTWNWQKQNPRGYEA